MEFLSHVHLSFGTQLASLLVPFTFFAYRSKFRRSEILAARADILYGIVLTALLVALLARVAGFAGADSFGEQLQATVLHVLPLLLGFFQILFYRSAGGRVASNGAPSARPRTSTRPLNKEIEQLGWDDLIIPETLREELVSIIRLLKNPKTAKEYGIEIPKGILLAGPPGTGKTTIAKVIANEAGLSFFALKLDEVISKWVGESEKNLTDLFESARRSAPAVLFIDEIDSIGKQRSGSSGQEHREGFLNHLLQLMDGVVKIEGLYIVAATNRPDLVDGALKRPGRLNKVIEVGLPDLEARRRLLELYLSRLKFEEQVDIEALAHLTEERSPAVIRELCNQVGLNAYKRESASGRVTGKVVAEDLQKALAEFL